MLMCGSRWVKTGNGQSFADSVGVKEPPMTLEESVNGVLEQVCHPLLPFSKLLFWHWPSPLEKVFAIWMLDRYCN